MTASGLRRQAGVALWVAACVAGGCAVERVTAVDSVDRGTDAGDMGGGGDASTDGAGPVETSSGSSGGESGIPSVVCTDAGAAYTTSDLEGQFPWPDSGYFFRNDAWNTDAGPGPQTLSACSYSSWNVVAKEPSTSTVKAYPDVQMDFPSGVNAGMGVPISSFKSITSTFDETSPPIGVYDDAYDIFVNSDMIIGPGTTEIMIWVDNHGNEVQAGSKVATVSLDTTGAYDVYETDRGDGGDGGHYIVFLANSNFSSGNVDILAFLNYVIKQGWIPANAPLNQICFGVEICETGGAPATFQFTNFSITATPN